MFVKYLKSIALTLVMATTLPASTEPLTLSFSLEELGSLIQALPQEMRQLVRDKYQSQLQSNPTALKEMNLIALRKQLVEQNNKIDHIQSKINDNKRDYLDPYEAKLSNVKSEKSSLCSANADLIFDSILDGTDAPSSEQQPIIEELLLRLNLPKDVNVRLITGESHRRLYPLSDEHRVLLEKALSDPRNQAYVWDLLNQYSDVSVSNGHEPEGMKRRWVSLATLSPTANQLLCCVAARLLGDQPLVDLAQNTCKCGLTILSSDTPHCEESFVYLPLGENFYEIPVIDPQTGRFSASRPLPEAILSHELDHWLTPLYKFLKSGYSGYKDLTLTCIFPHLQNIKADRDAFSRQMKDNHLFFNKVTQFFHQKQWYGESSEDFTQRVIHEAFEHWDDCVSRARVSWLSSEEIRDISGLQLIQGPKGQLTLFINTLSNLFQAFDTGAYIPWLHDTLDPVDGLSSFADCRANLDLVWLLGKLYGVPQSLYLQRHNDFCRNTYTPTPSSTLSVGPLNELWRYVFLVSNLLQQQLSDAARDNAE